MTVPVEIFTDQRARIDRISAVKGAEVLKEISLDDTKKLLILRKK
ncbi:hypothetical protein [Maridesulfovibrio frigidus]|nr:hypothetical protein [Maridesulfovibrio frigidus]